MRNLQPEELEEVSGGTFHRALSDLLKSGDLVNEGTDKRPFYRLASK